MSVVINLPRERTETRGAFRRWTVEKGFVDAYEAKGFAVSGFEKARLFTAVEIFEGEYAFFAYEGRAGLRIAGPKQFRNLCQNEAAAVLRTAGKTVFEAAVKSALDGRATDVKETA